MMDDTMVEYAAEDGQHAYKTDDPCEPPTNWPEAWREAWIGGWNAAFAADWAEQ